MSALAGDTEGLFCPLGHIGPGFEHDRIQFKKTDMIGSGHDREMSVPAPSSRCRGFAPCSPPSIPTSWQRTRDQDDSVPAGYFRVIARSGDLPNDMIMMASHVDAGVAEEIRSAILENKKESITSILTHEENEKYRGMDLVAIEDGAYDIVRSMYTTAGFAQYDTFIGD